MPGSIAELEAVESTSADTGVWTQGGDLKWDVRADQVRSDGYTNFEVSVENLSSETRELSTSTTQVVAVSGGSLAPVGQSSYETLQDKEPSNWGHDNTELEPGERTALNFRFMLSDPSDYRLVIGVRGYQPVAFVSDDS